MEIPLVLMFLQMNARASVLLPAVMKLYIATQFLLMDNELVTNDKQIL